MSAESSKEVCQDCAPISGIPAEQTTADGSTSAPAEPASTPAAEPKPEEQAPFTPPSLESLKPSITIEFCDRCRWAPRATWIQTELFLTFPTPLLKSITLQPLTSPETGGRFRVWIYLDDRVEMVWDRKTEGGFPELKILKQRIRNVLQPDLSLGHSDKPSQVQKA